MTDIELWNLLTTTGQLRCGWWYSAAALPALLLGVVAYGLTWSARRSVAGLPALFVWLVLASLPLLAILPSAYVASAPRAALARAGFPMNVPAAQIGGQIVREASAQLTRLALLGQLGSALAAAMIGTSLVSGGYARALRRLSPRVTHAMTQTFGRRTAHDRSGLAAPAAVHVARGQQRGTRFGVINGALIGKEQATMTITDPIVSRRHARFEIRDNLTLLIDEGSTNGTHVRRADRLHRVQAQGLPIERGDHIFLGHPDEPAAVELVFEVAR